MKILLTLPSLMDPGGITNFYNTILPYLINTRSFQINKLEIGSTHGYLKLLHPVMDQLRFRKELLNNPSFIHINPSLNFKSFIRDGFLIWQAKRKKFSVLVFFHGWDKKFERCIKLKLLYFFLKTYGKADAFIVLASEFKQSLRNFGLKQPIYLGKTIIDDSLLVDFDINKKITNFNSKKQIRILFLSRLEKEKGIFEAIDAFYILIKKGYNITMSIAGDGKIRYDIMTYLNKNLKLSQNIIFLGYIKNTEKANALINHDIYCFPTYYSEGMPISVVEAISFGLPVITTPVGGLADIFKDEKMGFLVSDIDPKNIADKIEILINNRQLMCKIAGYNYHFAKENFYASVIANYLTTIYEKLGSNSRHDF